MRGLRLALAVVLVLGAARAASAVCTASDVVQCGANCWKCSGNTCTLGKLLTVTPPAPGAVCTFDFGGIDVVLAGGGFTAGSNSFAIRAHGLTVGASGTLKATGNTTAPGGIVTLTLGAGGFTLVKSANVIDLTGAPPAMGSGGGGSLLVQSDGNVSLAGSVLVDGATTNASGGTIMVTAGRLSGSTVVASADISVTGSLSAGGKASGFGGTISFSATGVTGSGTIDVENKILALGGLAGGDLTLHASGDVILGVNPNGGPLLVADGNGDAACGGSIDVLAGGSIGGTGGVTGQISARGSNAIFSPNGGGAGGTISFEAQRGTVTLGGGVLGGVLADGGTNGCGGSVCINTDKPGAGVTVGVPISAISGGPAGFGGCILVCSSGAAVVHGDIDASAGGCGGAAEVDSLQGLTVESPAKAIHADAVAGSGGCVTLSAGGPVTLSGPLLNASTPASLPANSGGEVDVFSNVSITANGPIDVSAIGPNLGGTIDMEAGTDLFVGSAATLNADGGRTGGSGGVLALLAGVPDLPGTLTVNANAHATGTSTIGAPALAQLGGCAIHVGSTGIINTAGDPLAANFLTARTSLAIDAGAAIHTTGVDPKSRNFVTLPVGSAFPSSPAFSPPLQPSDVQFEPSCTAPNTPPNCLTPCPVCGNGRTEFPETCDAGSANGPCQACGPMCRVVNCDDRNACTTDTCDPIAGCQNVPIPNCTTTTTTLATTTSTTLVTTTTTSTLPSTSSTTTSLPTTSTTSTSSSTTTAPTTTTTTVPTTTSTTLATTTTTTLATTTTTTTTRPTTSSTTTTSTILQTTTTTSTSSTTTSVPTTSTTSTSSSTTTAPTTTTAPSTTSSSTTTTSTLASTTTTTAPPECTPGPNACDDGDRCTRDSCVGGQCHHDPVTGFDAVFCRLDTITALLGAAPPTSLGGAARQGRLEHAIARARRVTVTARGESGRRRVDQLRDAEGLVSKFARSVQANVRRGKVDEGLGMRLVGLGREAAAELAALRGGA